MLRSVRSHRKGLLQVTPRASLFLVCSICCCFLQGCCNDDDGDDDANDDDDGDDDNVGDDDNKDDEDDRDEKKQNWFFFASRLRRYQLPSFYLPTTTRSLRARGGLLIHRKVGQAAIASPTKMNYDVGDPRLISYWRRFYPTFRQPSPSALCRYPRCPSPLSRFS